jgi:hypothetical protein
MADGGCFLSTSKKGTRHETDINVFILCDDPKPRPTEFELNLAPHVRIVGRPFKCENHSTHRAGHI